MNVFDKFILLDRDGVINLNRKNHVKCVEDFEVYQKSIDEINMCRHLGVEFAVASNQSWINSDPVLELELDKIDKKLDSYLEYPIKKFYCKHNKSYLCMCRKPKPGLLYDAENYFKRRVDVFVGDNITDYLAAKSYGCDFVLVISGRGKEFLQYIEKNLIYSDLAEYLKSLRGNNAKTAQ
jgi:D-glycero-D-manno-heptose 1,7-bisphosphate phosphatase